MKNKKKSKKNEHKLNNGWACIKCSRSFAPHVEECKYCNEKCVSPAPSIIPEPLVPFDPWVNPFEPAYYPMPIWGEKDFTVGDPYPIRVADNKPIIIDEFAPVKIETTGIKYHSAEIVGSTCLPIDGNIPVQQCMTYNEGEDFVY